MSAPDVGDSVPDKSPDIKTTKLSLRRMYLKSLSLCAE
jgi:hypothetical protein